MEKARWGRWFRFDIHINEADYSEPNSSSSVPSWPGTGVVNNFYNPMSRASALLARFSRHAKAPKPALARALPTELIVTILSFLRLEQLLLCRLVFMLSSES